MKNIIKKINTRISEHSLYANVKSISSFHRIQASPGYRAAAQELCCELKRYGIQAEVKTYPADGKSWSLCGKHFMEWSCSSALLKDSEGNIWADFIAEPTSVIQKSYPCDFKKDGLDLVYLPEIKNFNYPEEIDLEGKLVFYRGAVSSIHRWAVGEKGALGFVTDYISLEKGVRDRNNMYDSRAYTSFWWDHDQEDLPCFGFVISPRQGDQLMDLCDERAKAHRDGLSDSPYLRFYPYVDSALYAGNFEVVEAKLPGQSEEEVLLVSHLCHPRPSANDNASGVAAVCEALRCLKGLEEDGELPGLKRGITAIFVPEFTGTYAYLAEREFELERIKAGLNLDMVGGKMGEGYGPLTISSIPDVSESFVTSLAELINNELFAEVSCHSGVDRVSTYLHSTSAFDPGSDHYILSDPTIGIPTPMLGQWPDRNYHTSTDDIEMIDPAVLKKSSSLAAAYAYLLSNLKVDYIPAILNQARARLERRCHQALDLYKSGSDANLGFNAKYLYNIFSERAESIKEFFSELEELREVSMFIEKEKVWAKGYLDLYQTDHQEESIHFDPSMDQPEYQEVWLRRYRAPITHITDHFAGEKDLYAAYDQYLVSTRSKEKNAFRMEAICQLELATGKNIGEIIHALSMQFPKPRKELEAFFFAYLDMLKKLNLVERQSGE